ncbi:MAG: PqqD family protein [Rothia sp. (in: high G+C Gram-positive bacteria)]|nr:PqqD family protein [Rothia sp. (in: high G+C Gram-positive bacteria)]
MTFIYKRAQAVAYVMGFEDNGYSDEFSYIANLNTSQISALSGPAALMWEILERPQASEDIVQEVSTIYGVSQETVAGAVISFLDDLLQQGLIEIDKSPEEAS